MAQGLGARGHHRAHAPMQRLRPPVRALLAPCSRARAARLFSFVISNDPVECLRLVVFKTRFATPRDDHLFLLSRSRVLAFSRSRRYKRGWFCSWCSTVYRKREGDNDPRALGSEPGAKLWVGCDRCDRWTHLSCEHANDPASLEKGREVTFEAGGSRVGNDRTTDDQATQATQTTHTAQTTRRVYHCPSCRGYDRTWEAVEHLSRLSDRDPSWASSSLSRVAGATLTTFGVVAHVRPYLRERDQSSSRLRGAEATRANRKRGRGGLGLIAARDAPRAEKMPRSALKHATKAPSEERPEGDDSTGALAQGSAFGSAGNARRGVPTATRTFRGRPKASRAGAAAADALKAADAAPKMEAATRGPAEAPAEAAPLPNSASLDACAADVDAKTIVTDGVASRENASPTVSPAEPTVAAAPANAAAPEKNARSPAPAAPPVAPLRGDTGVARGLRLPRPATQGQPLLSMRAERSSPPETRAAMPSDPNAVTLRAVNAFVAGGARPGGSMLVRLLADSLASGSRSGSTPSLAVDADGGARALHEAPEEPPSSLAREKRARFPARSSSSALATGASGSAKPTERNAPPGLGALVSAAKGKEKERQEAAATSPFPPTSSALDPVSGQNEDVILLHDADADPWGLGCKQEWSDAMDWVDSV